ncbi:hypothetical protein KKC22_03615 [Myxococcota bacterium]|nr:hypothetical protein [Myxococcota bacterium]
MAACWATPPDCEICQDTRFCPKSDGGVDDFDVVGDVVQPDIPETEPDPYLYMVECAAMTGGGLAGYLGYYGTWGNWIILGYGNFPSTTERYTQLYIVEMENLTIRDIGSVPEVDAHISEALVIEEASRMAFFITSRWEVPAGCTQSYCRYNYGTLWGI